MKKMKQVSVMMALLLGFATTSMEAFALVQQRSKDISKQQHAAAAAAATATVTFTSRSRVELEETIGQGRRSKRKKAAKTIQRLAGATATIAVASSTLGVGPAKAASAAVSSSFRNIIGAGFIVGALTALFGTTTTSLGANGPATGVTLESMRQAFPGAVTNQKLVSKVSKVLTKKYPQYGGNGGSTLVATSLCTDEVNRGLETAFAKRFGGYKKNNSYNYYNMGGLAGFPFGGVTSFGAMASHIPDGGSSLIVFGPHVGIDSNGVIGSLDRRSDSSLPCCGSAVRAASHVMTTTKAQAQSSSTGRTTTKSAAASTAPENDNNNLLDAQQKYVQTLLLPYASRLEEVPDTMVELPYALYDSQKKMMMDIVTTSARSVAGNGKIAVLGGIGINTPPGMTDYYLPLSFEVYDNTGTKLEDLTL